jgi:DNA replication protein DnaC
MNDFDNILGVGKIEKLRDKARTERMVEGKGCALCDYSGYTFNEDGLSSMCSCQKKKFFKELFTLANVPAVFLEKTVLDWDYRNGKNGKDLGSQQDISQKIFALISFYDKQMINICKNESPKIKHSGGVKQPLHSVMFEGTIGSGKTFIAAVLIQSAIKKGLTAKYYEFPNIIDTLTKTDKNDQAEHLYDEFKNLDLIAIDCIQNYDYYAKFSLQLDRISAARLNSGKPTLLFTDGNAASISSGSSWNSLLRSCITVRLPYVR